MNKDDLGMQLIYTERNEQVYKHGFTLERDAEYYKNGELLQAAAFCLDQANLIPQIGEKVKWPTGWGAEWADKIRKKDKVGKLKVAGAFYLAECERLQSDAYKDDVEKIARQINAILNEQA